MRKFKNFLLIFHFLIKFSIQQDLFLSCEESIQKSNEDLIKNELEIVKKLSNLNSYVRISNLNLKAVKIAQNLSSIFDTTLYTIGQLKSLKSYQTFISIENYSKCDFMDIRMSFLDLDRKKFYSVISEIEKNFTKIYENFSSITFNYAENLRILSMNWTRERSVVNTFKQFTITFDGYFKYIGKLRNNLINYGNYQSFLNEISSNCTFTNSSFGNHGNKIEDNLIKCQNDLINVENQTIQKINAALMTVTTSVRKVRSISSQKFSLQKMKNNLGKFSTANDFKKVSWPHIPDTTGQASAIPMKLRIVQEKKESYSKIWKNHFKNRTNLENDENDLNSNLQMGKRRRKRSINPVIDEVLTLTLNVQNQFTTCMQLLNDSMIEIDQMIVDILTPTTTTISTSTTTEIPCGLFYLNKKFLKFLLEK